MNAPCHVWNRPRGWVFALVWAVLGCVSALGSDVCAQTPLRMIPQHGHAPVGDPSEAPRVAWSPDGARIATAQAGPTVKLWDAATGRLAHNLSDGHLGIVIGLTWSPDGRFVIVESSDMNRVVIVVWDAVSGKRVADLSGFLLTLDGYAWDVPHQRLGVRSERSVAAWSLRSGKLIFDHLEGTYGWPPKEADTPSEAIAWAPDGGALVAAYEGELTTHHPKTGAAGSKLRVAPLPLRALAWSAGGAWFAAHAEDNTLAFGTLPLKAASMRPAHARIVDFAWAPDGARFAWTRYPEGDPNPTLSLGVGEAPKAAHVGPVALKDGERLRGWSRDGTRLITERPDAPPRVWEANTGKLAYAVKLPPKVPNTHATLGPNGAHVLAYTPDHAAALWNARTGARMHAMPAPEVSPTPLMWSPDGTRAVVVLYGGPPMVWAPATRAFVPLEGVGGAVEGVAWHPHRARIGAIVTLASGGGSVARVWDANTGKLARPQPKQPPPWLKPDAGLSVCPLLMGACPSPSGDRTVTLEGDRFFIQARDAKAQPAKVRVRPGSLSELDRFVWGPRGRVLVHERCTDPDDPPVACGASTLELIDPASGQRLRALPGAFMGWSPDGRYMLVRPPVDDPYRYSEVEAIVWDLKLGRRLRKVRVSQDAVASWSPDGRRLSVAQDDHVRVWRMDAPRGPGLTVTFDARGRWCAAVDGGGYAASAGSAALLGAAREDGQVVPIDRHPQAKRALEAVAGLVAGSKP